LNPPEHITDLFWIARVIAVSAPFLKIHWWQVKAPHSYGMARATYYLVPSDEAEQNITMVIQKVRLTKKNMIHKQDFQNIISHLIV